MRTFKQIVLSLAVSLGLTFGVNALVAVPALASASSASACGALSQLDTSQDCGSAAGQNVVNSLSYTIVNTLSLILGVIAVIVIIVGGLRYVLAGGDANKVSSAKNTIIYALVGLVVAALAQFLVHFVLTSVK